MKYLITLLKRLFYYLKDISYPLMRRYEVWQFDRYRKLYDSFSFDFKKKLAQKWLTQYPDQAHFTYAAINYWLLNIVKRPAIILEIGGWRGDLAEKALSSFDFIETWHNYDLLEYNDSQKCHDKRYSLITLDDYLWRVPLTFEYNSLIATHMIEHLKWREFTELVTWIPECIRTILFEAPLTASGENINWKGDFSSHVLEKGWEEVVNEMKSRGFSADHIDVNTYIFMR